MTAPSGGAGNHRGQTAPARRRNTLRVGFMTHEEIVEARLLEISQHVAAGVEFVALAAFGVGVLVGIAFVFAWLEGTKRRNVV